MMSIRARVAQWQGFYYAATGLWALFDLAGFEAITGPKTDHWLVRLVALLAIAIGTSLLVGARRAPGPQTQVLAMGCAAAFFSVDCVYVWQDVISPIYLVDAAAEAAIVVAWSLGQRRRLRVDILRRAAPHWRSQQSR